MLVNRKPHTSSLCSEVETASIYLFLPLQLKLPPQEAIKIAYLGTTANISCLITNTSNLKGEDMKKVTMF